MGRQFIWKVIPRIKDEGPGRIKEENRESQYNYALLSCFPSYKTRANLIELSQEDMEYLSEFST